MKKQLFALVLCALALSGCAATTELGAFDLSSDRTGNVDENGFPILVGPQYERDVPLKRTIERVALESELEAIALSRQDPSLNVDKRRSQILQQRLQALARTHGARARAEIAAACRTDDAGIVICRPS